MGTNPIKRRAAWARHLAAALGCTIVLGAAAGNAAAAPSEVTIPGDRAFPESVTSTRDGTLFVGGFAQGGVFRAAPGAATAEPWIKPEANGSRSILGVLADEDSGTLCACSNDLTGIGVPSPGTGKGSALKSFDLKTGSGKGSVALPGERTL